MLRQSLVFALPLALAVVGCSPDPDPMPERESEISAPPGTARLLSLGSHMVDEGQTGAELAVNCAVALRVTEAAVAPMATSANAAEIQLVTRAAQIYTDRAVAAADGRSQREVVAGIARAVKDKANEKNTQAQLAIVCLRSLQQG